MSGFNSALASITASYTDSDEEDDEPTLSPVEDSVHEAEFVATPPKEARPEQSQHHPNEIEPDQMEVQTQTTSRTGLVSYFDPIDDYAIDDYTPEIHRDSEAKDEDSMDTSSSLADADEPEVIPDALSKRRALLPPEPKGTCTAKLQSKFNKLNEDKMKGKVNMNEYIQNRKMFRNPSIYEKLIQFCGIKEFGTNYPPEVYDPYEWPESSNYLNLAKLQKEEMERREKAKKERVKIEYVSGAVKKPLGLVTSIPVGTSAPLVINPNQSTDSEAKRKSKWDQKVTLPTVNILKK